MPLPGPFRPSWARGRLQPNVLFVLVELDTDEGVTGITTAHAGLEAAVAMHRFVAPYWLGEDPTQVERLVGVLRDAEILGPPMYCLEVALWDIIGKLASLPVATLWGGYRRSVLAYCSFAEVRSAAQRVEDVQRARDQGFKAVKLRFHSDEPRDDLAILEAIRSELGDTIDLMVDANQAGVEPGHEGHKAWDFHTALAVGRELERLNVTWLEEPLPRHDYDGLRRLRGCLPGLAIAGGEDNHGLHEFRLLIDRECYDILQPDAMLSEGVGSLRKIAALAEAHGLAVQPHAWSNGIGLLANLHFAATLAGTPYIEYPHDPPSGWTAESRDQMLTTPIAVAMDGTVAIPDKPGFGIALDEDRIARHVTAEEVLQ